MNQDSRVLVSGNLASPRRLIAGLLAQLGFLKIDEDTARRLVVRGFFADVIQEVGVPAVEERLTKAIDKELELIDE